MVGDGMPSAAARLAQLRRITDAKLRYLSLDELLDELLDRLRLIFDADTAVVLLLDEAAQELEARASSGLDVAVRQDVRIPVGNGFAGRVAAGRGAMQLDRVDVTTVANPLLWEKGVQVLLGAPLVSSDRVLGVVHVGRLDRRPFDDADTELLEVAAERIVTAVQAQELAAEHAALDLIERSLRPRTLPVISEFAFATRYVPSGARSVGGDWYDLFSLPSGQLWVIVGDVAGHGLESALVMGRLRSALRAYTLLGLPPSAALEFLDKQAQEFESGMFATVLCGLTRPPYNAISFATAGHPPPVVAPRDGSPFIAGLPVGPPIGVSATSARASARLPLDPGTVIALYSDGLIERRGETLDEGMRRLTHAMSADHPRHVARRLMSTLVGDHTPDDDIALLVLRRR